MYLINVYTFFDSFELLFIIDVENNTRQRGNNFTATLGLVVHAAGLLA